MELKRGLSVPLDIGNPLFCRNDGAYGSRITVYCKLQRLSIGDIAIMEQNQCE